MSCCGRSSASNQRSKFIKPNIPSSSLPRRVSKNSCTKCGGSMQSSPEKVKVGTQNLTKYKCTFCAAIYYLM